MRVKDFRHVEPGTHVRVHKNLQTGTWVIQTKTKGRGWSVAEWRDEVSLSAVIAKDSAAGAARVVRHNRRKVVAWVEGTLEKTRAPQPGEGVEVHFNPFRRPDFHTLDGESWRDGKCAYFPPGGGFFISY